MYAIWTLIFSLYHVYHNDYEAKKFTSCIQHLKMEFNEMSKLHDCHYNLLNTNSLAETRWLKYTIFQRIDCLTLDLHFGDDINVTRCVGDCRICNV